MMKRIMIALLAVGLITATIAFSGCSKKEKTVAGALIGVGAGAGIGSALGNTEGAIAGGLLGGVAGGLIGNSMGDDEKAKK